MSRPIRSKMESVGVYLPPKAVSTRDVVKGCSNRVMLPLERLTGISSRRVAGETEWGYDLAVKAVRDCLAVSQYGADDIDILINCNISHYDGKDVCSFEPSRSSRMRKAFGMHHALGFDLTNACAGMFTGIYLVDLLIRAGVVRRGLVVSGEYITHLTETAQMEIKGIADQRAACLTLGDAGAAVLVDAASDDETGFHALDLYTIGKHSPLCIAKVTDQPHGGVIMVTDMIQLANISVSAFLQQSALTIVRLGWPAGRIRHILPHQTSKTTLDTGSREVKRLVEERGLKIDKDMLINNVADRGNTATTSHFVALKDSCVSGRIKPGEGIMFGVLASGITVGTAVYQFDDLPERLAKDPGVGDHESPEPSLEPGIFTRPGLQPRVRIESVGVLDVDRRGRSDSLTMLTEACTTCLSGSSHAAGDIDLLLCTAVYKTGHLAEPAVAALLAGLLKVNDNPPNPLAETSLAFDVLNGGLGFLNACYLASELIQFSAARRVLVTTSEVEITAKLAPDNLRGLAQTASAVTLDIEQDGSEGFGAFCFQYFPETEDSLQVYTNIREPQSDGRLAPGLHVEKAADADQQFLRCIVETVTQFLSSQDLTLAEIAVVLPPQISSPFIAELAGALEIDPEKCIDVCRPEGDLFTSSLPYAFGAARCPGGPAASGDLGLIINVASGIEVGCAIYHF